MTTELLGLHPPGVSDQQCPVISHQLLLQLQGTVGVNVLGVVGDEGLGDGLSDGVHLRGVSSTLHSDADIKGSKGVLSGNKDGLVDLQAEDLRLNEVDGGAVNTDEATAFPGVGDSSRGLGIERITLNTTPLPTNRHATYFLFAESLDGLD